MKTVKGDIFSFIRPGFGICIPTNGCLNKKGHLVMGKGLAKEFDKRYNLAPSFGELVYKKGNHVFIGKVSYQTDGFVYFLSFPTKNDWHDPSDITLIEQSCRELNEIVDLLNIQAYLPLPGCGLGGLEPSYVLSVITPILSDRVNLVLKETD